MTGALNGAYYGPAVPPANKNYHRPSRGGDCCCCSCVGWCGCCIFKCLFQILLTIAFFVGIIILIVWLIFRPVNKVKFHVTDASLTQFNVTNANYLHYNLNLTLSVRNPNKKIGVYYDSIEARAYYEDQRFASVFLPTFYQGHKNTTTLPIQFKGERLIVLGSDERNDFDKDKTAGVYDIDVVLRLKVRFKLGIFKTPRWFKPKIGCDLKVPLTADGKAASSRFETTKCGFDL